FFSKNSHNSNSRIEILLVINDFLFFCRSFNVKRGINFIEIIMLSIKNIVLTITLIQNEFQSKLQKKDSIIIVVV
ncbi:hypothetical protein, partial [Marinifilum fragile]|uniref:hypothetical protein n=1 Tax=Marinifilum fragile TaxID=570161 RepID=UPI001C47A5E4